MRNSVLEFNDVGKRAGEGWPVRHLSCHAAPGEILGLVSPGEGKTIALELAAGLSRADEGQVRVEGFDAWAERNVLRHRIGFLPQRLGRYPHTTVAEYLQLFTEGHDVPRPQRSGLIEELIELMDLQRYRDTEVDDVPEDVRPWLGFARCLIHDPDLLLLDEPTALFEVDAIAEFGPILEELSNLGKTVVLTASHAFQIERWCGQVVSIEG